MNRIIFNFLAVLIIFFVISCSDSNDPEAISIEIEPFTASIDENPSDGQSVGTVSASVNRGTLVYSIASQAPPGALSINAETGELTVADGSLFDFEIYPEIAGQVSVSAEGISANEVFTITLNDVDETIGFTIWTGPTLTFTKADGTDPTLEENQDRLTDNVWITRGTSGGQIYNIQVEDDANQQLSPIGTEWAIGTTANTASLTFDDFRDAVGSPKNIVGKELVLHLIDDDVYLDVKFTSWSQGLGNGGFAYERSTQ